MIGLATFAGIAVVVAAAFVVSARNGRDVVVSLLGTLAIAPLVATPIGDPLPIVFRGLGALLGAYLLWIGVRTGGLTSEGSSMGIAGELLVGAAGFAAGWWAAPVQPLEGPIAAQAAGAGLICLSVLPLLSRNVFRVGVGVALLTLGLSLLGEAWLGTEPALQQMGLTVMLICVLGATGVLVDPLDEPAALRFARERVLSFIPVVAAPAPQIEPEPARPSIPKPLIATPVVGPRPSPAVPATSVSVRDPQTKPAASKADMLGIRTSHVARPAPPSPAQTDPAAEAAEKPERRRNPRAGGPLR